MRFVQRIRSFNEIVERLTNSFNEFVGRNRSTLNDSKTFNEFRALLSLEVLTSESLSLLSLDFSLTLSSLCFLKRARQKFQRVAGCPGEKKSFILTLFWVSYHPSPPLQLFRVRLQIAKQHGRSIARQPYLSGMSRVEFVAQSSSTLWYF